MNKLKKVTISIPPRLFELGLSEAQIHGLTNRWFVISLFQQGKISAIEAGEFLSTDRDGFLGMLDTLGILYQDEAVSPSLPARQSPQLAELDRIQEQVNTLEDALAKTRYNLFTTKRELGLAERMQSDFIATVSHELRTPLNSIIGFAKFLLSKKIGPLNEIQFTDLTLIYDSAQYLYNLVNDILDLSSIKAEKMRLTLEQIAVKDVIAGVIDSTQILIADKPVELKKVVEPNLSSIYADRVRIRQVLINLLSNAVKFTDEGSITLLIVPFKENKKGFVHFQVEDSGIGISKHDIDKVFEPFQQIDDLAARRAKGTGLGMSISAGLVELHGGQIWVESKIGQGSTFNFIIPVKPEQDK